MEKTYKLFCSANVVAKWLFHVAFFFFLDKPRLSVFNASYLHQSYPVIGLDFSREYKLRKRDWQNRGHGLLFIRVGIISPQIPRSEPVSCLLLWVEKIFKKNTLTLILVYYYYCYHHLSLMQVIETTSAGETMKVTLTFTGDFRGGNSRGRPAMLKFMLPYENGSKVENIKTSRKGS